jgi:hypothetical protein
MFGQCLLDVLLYVQRRILHLRVQLVFAGQFQIVLRLEDKYLIGVAVGEPRLHCFLRDEEGVHNGHHMRSQILQQQFLEISES